MASLQIRHSNALVDSVDKLGLRGIAFARLVLANGAQAEVEIPAGMAFFVLCLSEQASVNGSSEIALAALDGCIGYSGDNVVHVRQSGRGECACLVLDEAHQAFESFPMVTRLELKRLSAAVGTGPKVVSDCDSSFLASSLDWIRTELAGSEHHARALSGVVHDMATELIEAVAPPKMGILSLREVLTYLEQHCDTASLERTAKHFSCHPNTLARFISREMGETFSALVTTIRMERAMSLLVETRISIDEVAHLCGYANMSHFYTLFQKAYGMAPGSVRRDKK